MLKTIRLATLVSCILFITACQNTPTRPSDSITHTHFLQLHQSTWILTHLGSLEVRPDPNLRNIPSIQFDADHQVSGADGCNRIMGRYTIGRDTLTLNPIATTKMACPQNTFIPAKFNQALRQVTHYQVYNQTLKLLDSSGNPLLTFIRSVQPR
jgi:heat shock protein HslJ